MQNKSLKKLNNKGGKRIGSGRKKADYQTKTIAFRVRLEWADELKALVRAKLNEWRRL